MVMKRIPQNPERTPDERASQSKESSMAQIIPEISTNSKNGTDLNDVPLRNLRTEANLLHWRINSNDPDKQRCDDAIAKLQEKRLRQFKQLRDRSQGERSR
jgi:hypothetical protein